MIRVVSAFEHNVIKVDEGYNNGKPTLSQKEFKLLKEFGYRTREKYFSVGDQRIKLKNFVGALQIGALSLEILPKVDSTEHDNQASKWRGALIEMLDATGKLRVYERHDASLTFNKAKLIDIIIYSYLDEVEKLVNQGLNKSYSRVKRNEAVCKGSIDFPRHIKENLFRGERFYASQNIYHQNDKLNKILKAALIIIEKTYPNTDTLIRTKKLSLFFENIPCESFREQDFISVVFTRATLRYGKALRLARLILLGHSFDLKTGPNDVISFLFDMNALWEEYVYEILRKYVSRNFHRSEVYSQPTIPFWGANHFLKPDILIKGKRTAIIDTKWKTPKNLQPSGADLRQMFAYNLHFDSTIAALVYPYSGSDCSLANNFRHPNFNQVHCRIAFINIFDKSGKIDRNSLGERIIKTALPELIGEPNSKDR